MSIEGALGLAWLIGVPISMGIWGAYSQWESRRNGEGIHTDAGMCLGVGIFWPFVILLAVGYMPVAMLLPTDEPEEATHP